MKFLQRFWPYAIVPVVILALHVAGLAITPFSNSPYSEKVMFSLYAIPVFAGMIIEEPLLGDCPGLGFDGGPCEGAEHVIFIGCIILWWILLTFIIAQIIQIVRKIQTKRKQM